MSDNQKTLLDKISACFHQVLHDMEDGETERVLCLTYNKNGIGLHSAGFESADLVDIMHALDVAKMELWEELYAEDDESLLEHAPIDGQGH